MHLKMSVKRRLFCPGEMGYIDPDFFTCSLIMGMVGAGDSWLLVWEGPIIGHGEFFERTKSEG